HHGGGRWHYPDRRRRAFEGTGRRRGLWARQLLERNRRFHPYPRPEALTISPRSCCVPTAIRHLAPLVSVANRLGQPGDRRRRTPPARHGPAYKVLRANSTQRRISSVKGSWASSSGPYHPTWVASWLGLISTEPTGRAK